MKEGLIIGICTAAVTLRFWSILSDDIHLPVLPTHALASVSARSSSYPISALLRTAPRLPSVDAIGDISIEGAEQGMALAMVYKSETTMALTVVLRAIGQPLTYDAPEYVSNAGSLMPDRGFDLNWRQHGGKLPGTALLPRQMLVAALSNSSASAIGWEDLCFRPASLHPIMSFTMQLVNDTIGVTGQALTCSRSGRGYGENMLVARQTSSLHNKLLITGP